MGQKVNPIGLRLGVNRTWDSRWYANKKEYGKLLQEDILIRNHLLEKLKQAGADLANEGVVLITNDTLASKLGS